MRRLLRSELPADTIALARFLIGATLAHDLPDGRVGGRIVETEAYPPGDPAAHAFAGRTRRNASLFLDRGHAYVYLGYGLHCLFNVSSESAGIGAGVLVRALEPVEGIAAMQARRRTARLLDLARGPGRLAQAMGIGMALDGADLCADMGTAPPLWLAPPPRAPGAIGSSKRIGITKAASAELRFFELGNPFVSGPRALNR